MCLENKLVLLKEKLNDYICTGNNLGGKRDNLSLHCSIQECKTQYYSEVDSCYFRPLCNSINVFSKATGKAGNKLKHN
jgi:hypothetical protein